MNPLTSIGPASAATGLGGGDGWIRPGAGAPGLERMEARFRGRPFAPHRHDTYAIGITLFGVQTFRFRGATWHGLPGQCHVLNPDELHDGEAGTAEGFGYRMVHVDPALVRQALGQRPLPFVAEPVVDLAGRVAPEYSDIWALDDALDSVACTDLLQSIVQLLLGASSSRGSGAGRLAIPALTRVRDLIAGNPAQQHGMDQLERVAGLDRWTLARQFRLLYGTSPSRFRTRRQVDLARQAMRAGASIAQAAADAGFADQSHFSRQFKRALGLSPGRWAAALASSRRVP